MNDLTVEVVSEPDRFRELETPWTDLLGRCADASAAQSFPFAWAAWTRVASQAGALRIIAIWRRERLKCVWPLHIRRRGPLTVALHLGSGSNEEYSGPVIGDDHRADDLAALALVSAKSLADVLYVYNLGWREPISSVIEADGAFKHRGSVLTSSAVVSSLPDLATWLNTKPKKFRQVLRRGRRYLSSTGQAGFSRLVDPEGVAEFVNWMFDRKLEFLEHNGIGASWIRRPESRAFYTELLSLPPSDRGVMAFTLRLDARIVAGAICLVAGSMEFLATAYDRSYAEASPGGLILEDLVAFCISRGLDLDLRIGDEPYKHRWVDRWDERRTYVIATTPRGMGVVAIAKGRGMLRTARRSLGPIVKRLMRDGRPAMPR